MSITEDAPAPHTARRSPLQIPGRARRASPWWWLVLVSSVLLVAALAVVSVWGFASRETQVSRYRGDLGLARGEAPDAHDGERGDQQHRGDEDQPPPRRRPPGAARYLQR